MTLAAQEETSPTSLHSSSTIASSLRFGLNNKCTKKILVYTRSGGVHYSSELELCKALDKDRSLRCSKMPIPWGHSAIEVHHGDLFPEPERSRFAHFPNMKLSLSSINLPSLVRLKRLLGSFKELYIISPETSPNSSPEHSQFIASRQYTMASSAALSSQPNPTSQ